jgi:hypothetical protein
MWRDVTRFLKSIEEAALLILFHVSKAWPAIMSDRLSTLHKLVKPSNYIVRHNGILRYI